MAYGEYDAHAARMRLMALPGTRAWGFAAAIRQGLCVLVIGFLALWGCLA